MPQTPRNALFALALLALPGAGALAFDPWPSPERHPDSLLPFDPPARSSPAILITRSDPTPTPLPALNPDGEAPLAPQEPAPSPPPPPPAPAAEPKPAAPEPNSGPEPAPPSPAPRWEPFTDPEPDPASSPPAQPQPAPTAHGPSDSAPPLADASPPRPFFDGPWSGYAFPGGAPAPPLSGCSSVIEPGLASASVRAGSLSWTGPAPQDKGWRAIAEAPEGGEWLWTRAPAAGPARAALSGPSLSCALARPDDFAAALSEARALASLPAPPGLGQPDLALLGFELADGSIGRACAALLSPSGALIRRAGSPDRLLPREALSFERSAPIRAASELFYSGASLRLARADGQWSASLFLSPASESAQSSHCHLASPGWWDRALPSPEAP